MTELDKKHCTPCEGDVCPYNADDASLQLQTLSTGWQITTDHKQVFKDFHFKNYYQTMAFVNAIAWMAHGENHHPDLLVGYNHCLVRYTTHAINGLSENDFICAAKVDSIYQPVHERQK